MMSERKATIVLYSLVISAVALFAGGVWAIVEYHFGKLEGRFNQLGEPHQDSTVERRLTTEELMAQIEELKLQIANLSPAQRAEFERRTRETLHLRLIETDPSQLGDNVSGKSK
jgi:hypothetical protein